MYYRKWITALVLACLLSLHTQAQENSAYETALQRSWELYEKGDWPLLLQFGRECLQQEQDFALLRHRMGYAAFMTTNYSEALRHYEAVLKKDSYNESANYYSRLCRQYLNQPEQAGAHDKYLSDTMKSQERIRGFAVRKAGIEVSYKNTRQPGRGNGLYARADLYTRITSGIHMQHSFALFNQTIAEPKFFAVINNNQIAINQKEYYNKTIVNLNNRWQFIGAYHYLNTPFNNFIYNNHVGLAGIRYNGNFIAMQADMIIGKLTDTGITQINARIEWLPKGNLDLYIFTTASFRSRNGTNGFNFKPVVGVKVMNRLWLEGNATLGAFNNLVENDGVYVYNAIDPNRLKMGATAYISVGKRYTAQIGYTFEDRTLFQTKQTFQQHSITGGITCQF